MSIPDSLAYNLRVILGIGVNDGDTLEMILDLLVTMIGIWRWVSSCFRAIFDMALNVFPKRRNLPMNAYSRHERRRGLPVNADFTIDMGVLVFRTRWTRVSISMLGLLEIAATDLLVSVPSPTRIISTLTAKQERIGTTFWFDVPSWVQVPGLCPNLQHGEVSLQYTATANGSSSNNNSAIQAQQLVNSLNTQSALAQSSNNIQGPSHLPSGFQQRPLATNQTLKPNANQQQPVPSKLHVFMTSKVGGHYLLSQWDTLTPRPQNDREFFEKLRECYISSRGFWRYHLGLEVFSHCEFYRVS
jgi:hypothetical protein